MTEIAIDISSLLTISQKAGLLKMSLAKRVSILRKVSRKVVKNSKKRVQTQTDLNGVAYKPRWHKRKTEPRRKMLSKLIKRLAIVSVSGESAKIAFTDGAGMIAAKQQLGDSQTVNARSAFGKQGTGGGGNGSASKRQVAALRTLGYRPNGSKKSRPSSMRWMQANLSMRQAGAIIRAMRLKAGIRPHTTWHTVLPARSFLGATDQEIEQYTQDIFEQVLAEINRAG